MGGVAVVVCGVWRCRSPGPRVHVQNGPAHTKQHTAHITAHTKQHTAHISQHTPHVKTTTPILLSTRTIQRAHSLSTHINMYSSHTHTTHINMDPLHPLPHTHINMHTPTHIRMHTPHTLSPVSTHRYRQLPHTHHHHQLACIARHGLNLCQIRRPECVEGYKLGYYALLKGVKPEWF